MQKNCQENYPSQKVGNQKAGRDGDAVEKCVNDQTDQDRVSLVSVNELVFVSLFSKMEVRGYGVLEEMNDQVADKNQKGRAPTAQFQSGGKYFDDGRCQHESRTQRDEIS